MVNDELINGEEPEKFISPLNVYLKTWGLALFESGLFMILPFVFYFIWQMFKEHFQEMSVTFAVSVVIITIWVRYANNSFYLYKNNGVLRVINPYFPFKRDISYKFGDIKEILLLESVNRMKLTLNNGVSIWYPCACLQIDMFDEHFVEKTFDEFHVRLVQLKIKTSYPNQS